MGKPFLKTVMLSGAIIALTAPATAQVPAVMYHAHENLGFVEANFRDHMDFLSQNGYNTIDMDQFLDWYDNDAPLPLRPIILTVDDNYILGYTSMYPILRDRGMVAINYTHTRGIGVGAPKASWAQVNEMDANGAFLVESHSRTHPTLDTISAAQLYDEIHGSRQDILDNAGKVSNHFCYPYGRYNDNVIAELIAAGYKTGLTTISGINYRTTPIYELQRYGGDGINLATFRSRIKHDQLPPPPPRAGWILDDEDPHAYYDASQWARATVLPGYYGPSYHRRAAGDATTPQFRWAAIIPATETMRVHARWSSSPFNTSQAVYTIRTASGSLDVAVDQRGNGGAWIDLGTYYFDVNEPVEVFLQGGDDGFVVADSIWFEPVSITSVEGWILL